MSEVVDLFLGCDYERAVLQWTVNTHHSVNMKEASMITMDMYSCLFSFSLSFIDRLSINQVNG